MHPDKLLFSHNDLTVHQYQGPDLGYSWKEAPASGDPTRYAIKADDRIMTLSRKQWETLAEYFYKDCSVECEHNIAEPLPANWRWSDQA